MNTREILINAKTIIEDGTHWVQGSYEKDVADKGTCFCAVGAVYAVERGAGRKIGGPAHDLLHMACQELYPNAGCPENVNDGDLNADKADECHAAVLAMFDRAIELADDE